ncbi:MULTISPECIES: stage II sporulation protein M [Staphylococcus]|uniref:stage II sporulation protein M n=1 Tax=Staphylococcus TaxID=1279 RepID=UPI00257A98E6|nr:stage II sporulation protein M [Staphylococcus sp.]
MKIRDDNYKKRAFKFFLTMVLLFLISLTLSAVFSPPKESIESIIKGLPKNLSEMKGIDLVWDYIVQNGLKMPLQMFILALIPIPFLYSVTLIISSVLFGMVFGLLLHWNFKQGMVKMLAASPHLFIEMLAISFIASGFYMLNQSIIRKVTNKFKQDKKYNISFKSTFLNLLKIYILRALPLFILAAFVEAYVPQLLINLLHEL